MRVINLFLILIFFMLPYYSNAEQSEVSDKIVNFNFEKMEISDILKSISRGYEINIITEKDVTGIYSIRLSGVGLKNALNTFLSANGFKLSEKDGIFVVSKIKENPYIKLLNNKLTVHCDNIPINEIVRNISVQTNLNITTSQPLDNKITAHINNAEPVECLIKILADNNLSVSVENNYYKIFPVKPKFSITFNKAGGRISIDAQGTELAELLTEIGRKCEKNIIVEDNIRFNVTISLRDIEFESGLKILLDLYGLKFAMYENIIKVFKDNEGFKFPIIVKNQKVTADIRNGDLETALRQISSQTGYGLVLFKEIRAKVNLQLKDLPLVKALEILLKNTQLSFKFNDQEKLLYIGSAFAGQNESELFIYPVTYKFNYLPVKQIAMFLPKSINPQSISYIPEINSLILTAKSNEHSEFEELIKKLDIKQEQQIFPIKNIEIKDFLSLLPENLSQYPIKKLEDQNALLVSGSREMLSNVEEAVKLLDIKPPQISIEILVAEISDEAKRELGLSAFSGQEDKVSGVYSPLTGANVTFNSIGNLSRQFSFTMSALENKGLVEIKASPKITTRSGKQASISVGREENFRITIPSANSNVPLTQLEKIPSGIFLRIRPWASINSDQISVDITTEVSSSSGQASASDLPTISKKNTNSSLILKDGETIFIGGLKTLDVSDATDKFPLIGKIPFFGNLFSKNSKRNKKTELTFFITPKIIKENSNENRE